MVTAGTPINIVTEIRNGFPIKGYYDDNGNFQPLQPIPTPTPTPAPTPAPTPTPTPFDLTIYLDEREFLSKMVGNSYKSNKLYWMKLDTHL